MANQRELGVRGPYRVVNLPVKSDATFKQGDFVLFTTSGLTPAATAGNNFAQSTNNATRICGQATADAVNPNTGAVNPYVGVVIAEPGVQFCVPMYNASAASSVPALSYIGTAYEMRQSSGGFPQIDVATTTNAHAYVVDYDADDAPNWPTSITGGVQYANAWVEFKASVSLLTGAR